MPSSVINSDDGVVSGTSGIKTTGGDDGVLVFQTNGTDAVTVSAAQVCTFPNPPVMGVSGLTGDIAAARITNALNASGSAPIYACRAWVNFNGTGTVAIREDGNVSSITDHGTGSYSLNFATALPDANYAPTAMAGPASNNDGYCISFNDATTGGELGAGADPTTSALRIAIFRTSDMTKFDTPRLCLAIFR
jgi:hypothetical protein